MKHLIHRIAMILAIVCLGGAVAFAQQVKGTVKDGAGYPVIGASVLVDGTTNGTVCDLDGNFELTVPNPDATLNISSIGYKTVVIALEGRTWIEVVLEEDAELLDDVVVVGYGVQKKSVVTAAISSISSENLKKQSNTRVDNVLQGMTSGVTVTQSSGAPDAGSQVRIRGVGSIHDSAPLYIVDGLAISGGIDYLNPGDIERIEVLKDAASGAVYGARAANGVVLVTTKKGKAGKTTVSYDFSYGWQNVWRKPQVLNATEYAIMMNEAAINDGKAPVYDDPYQYGEGTDWVGAVLNRNAPVMKHDISVNGGTDRIQYAISAGYYTKEGIVGGNFGRSNYDRFTVHQNLNATAMDRTADRDYLNKLVLSTTVSYAHINSTGIDGNSEYGSPLGSAMAMSPIEPIFADDATVEGYRTRYTEQQFKYLVKEAGTGRYYTVADDAIYNEMKNPLADLSLPGTKYNTDKFIAGGSAELTIWDNLKFKTSVGVDLAFWGNHGYNIQYFLNAKRYNLDTVTTLEDGTTKTTYASSASMEKNRALRWQVENVLTYNKTFGKHTVGALLGQSAIRSQSSNVGASRQNIQYEYDPWKISVNTALGTQNDGQRNGWGSWNSIVYSLASYFARVSYNYDERYMAEATIRMDGSSRFGDNSKWGYFPSISLGWNFKNESFLKDVNWLSTGKLRASYGVNGNDSIGDFVYAVYMNGGNNYHFGVQGSTENLQQGSKPSGLANPNVRWEESRQFDLGLDLGFWGNKLTATFDYYDKTTKGMLLSLPVPSYTGESAPTGNLGNMANRGVEIELSYRDTYGDFSYFINANATFNKNKLTYLGDEATYLSASSGKYGVMARGDVGLPFPYFYGYKVEGVFQNQNDIDNYIWTNPETGATQKIQPNAVPGDLMMRDVNNDGQINDEDRTYIGKGMPDWNVGITLGFEWKGIDFSMLMQGQFGNVHTLNVYRRTDLPKVNLNKNVLNRWTGEGTSNTQPRFTTSDGLNLYISDALMENAAFLRCRNLQLGYTIPQKWTKKVGIQRLRVYGQAENLFTITKYTGCDPEVTGDSGGYGTAYGIDKGVYPQARTFSVGLNLNF